MSDLKVAVSPKKTFMALLFYTVSLQPPNSSMCSRYGVITWSVFQYYTFVVFIYSFAIVLCCYIWFTGCSIVVFWLMNKFPQSLCSRWLSLWVIFHLQLIWIFFFSADNSHSWNKRNNAIIIPFFPKGCKSPEHDCSLMMWRVLKQVCIWIILLFTA